MEEKPKHQRLCDMISFDKDESGNQDVGNWPFAEVADVIAEQSSKDE